MPLPIVVYEIPTQRKVGTITNFVDMVNAVSFRIIAPLQAFLALIMKELQDILP